MAASSDPWYPREGEMVTAAWSEDGLGIEINLYGQKVQLHPWAAHCLAVQIEDAVDRLNRSLDGG